MVQTQYTNNPLRLPRKLKKDIIKTSRREAYYQILHIMACQFALTGSQYIILKKHK